MVVGLYFKNIELPTRIAFDLDSHSNASAILSIEREAGLAAEYPNVGRVKLIDVEGNKHVIVVSELCMVITLSQ